MKESKYLSIPQLARIMGLTRIAVYKRVRKGQIKAIKVGRAYAIPRKYVSNILGGPLQKDDKAQIDRAVRKTVKEYGEVLKLLGKD